MKTVAALLALCLALCMAPAARGEGQFRVAAYDEATYLQHLHGGIWWAATGRGIIAPAD